MKAFFALGAIASLCQTAYSLNPGFYTIASANSDSKVLTVKGPNQPLVFEDVQGSPEQVWHFEPAGGDYFEIRGSKGSWINCAQEGARTCSAGGEPQAFIPEFQGGSNYELVEAGSGYFLRLAKDGSLQLAEYDGSIDEQFSLKPVAPRE